MLITEQGALFFEPPRPFNFLGLPAEIRVLVYRHVFVENKYEVPRAVLFRQPALSQVNRLVRREALPVYFANTDLIIRIPMPVCPCSYDYGFFKMDLDYVNSERDLEEQRWVALLDRLRLFALSGNLHKVKQLTISMGPVFVLDAHNDQYTTIQCFLNEPERPNIELCSLLMRRGEGWCRAMWGAMSGTRIGEDNTDWDDVDAIREALESATQALGSKLERIHPTMNPEVVHPTPVGRLVDAMHVLFGGHGAPKRWIVLGQVTPDQL